MIFGNAHEDSLPPLASSPSPAPGPSPSVSPPRAPGAAPWLDRNARYNVPNGPTTDGRPGLRERLAGIARGAGMELCGAGCMGFVNVAHGLRAIGYIEPDPPPAGPVALVTHSGSVFSAMLRTRRAIGYTLAVSSGQELVTTTPAYLDYALGLPETKVLGLVLEAIRDPAALRQVLARAAEREPARGPAHRGQLGQRADDGRGPLRRAGRRRRRLGGAGPPLRHPPGQRPGRAEPTPWSCSRSAAGCAPRPQAVPGAGIATVHDSGLERAHAADVADEVGVPFAAISETTKARLADLLDPGLLPTNPLDVWGTGADTRSLFAGSLLALAEDPSVTAVALAVDLIPELDGDLSYPQAVLEAASQTTSRSSCSATCPAPSTRSTPPSSAQQGVPVLEGMRTGLLALRHLLDHAARSPAGPSARTAPGRPRHAFASSRRDRGAALLAASPADSASLLALLHEYGIATAAAQQAGDADGALAAAESIGYPVVLKTDEPAIAHKSDAGGVVLGIARPGRARRRLRRPGGPARPAGAGLRDRAARHRAGAGHRPRPRTSAR